jgi:hypothetical protein
LVGQSSVAISSDKYKTTIKWKRILDNSKD